MAQNPPKRLFFIMIGSSIALVSLLFLLLPVSNTEAQPNPPGGQAPDVQATRDAAQGNVQATRDAIEANAQATRDAVSGNAQATQTAAFNNANSTRDAIEANAQATQTAVSGNVSGTREAVGGNVEATQTAVSNNIVGTATAIALTREARSADIIATGDARATLAYGTAQARATTASENFEVRATDAAATVSAIELQVTQSVENAQATVTAIAQEWEQYVDSLPEEAVEIIESYVDNSDIEYNSEDNTLSVTTFVSEARANESLDLVAAQAGYNPDDYTLDAVPGQLWLYVTQSDVEVILIYEIVVIDGDAEAVLVAAQLNGQPLPLEAVPDQVKTISSDSIALGYLSTTGIPYDDYDVYVNSVDITDAGILIDMTVILAG